MAMEASTFAVTLSIFFVRSTNDESDASNVLLALPTETRSTITVNDMWSSLSMLGLDVQHLEAMASGCTENITVAYDCTRLDKAAKMNRLLDIASEQLVAVRERHGELEKLQFQVSSLGATVETLQAQKQELECDKMRIASEITRLQQEDSLWGVRNIKEEEQDLFPVDEDAATEDGRTDPSSQPSPDVEPSV